MDLAVFMIRTTAEMQRFVVGYRGVGGLLDVGVITAQGGFRFLQKKEIAVQPEEPYPQCRPGRRPMGKARAARYTQSGSLGRT